MGFLHTCNSEIISIVTFATKPKSRPNSSVTSQYLTLLQRKEGALCTLAMDDGQVATWLSLVNLILKSYLFIALIHPIQWTIAYPLGADRPAKHQKKTSCVSTGRSVPSTSALARWRVVLPSCLDRVTSWHLFRLARTSVQAFS